MKEITPFYIATFFSISTYSYRESICRLKIRKCKISFACICIICPIAASVTNLNLITCCAVDFIPSKWNAACCWCGNINNKLIAHILKNRNIKGSCHWKNTCFWIAVIRWHSLACRRLNIFHIFIRIFIWRGRANIKLLKITRVLRFKTVCNILCTVVNRFIRISPRSAVAACSIAHISCSAISYQNVSACALLIALCGFIIKTNVIIIALICSPRHILIRGNWSNSTACWVNIRVCTVKLRCLICFKKACRPS